MTPKERKNFCPIERSWSQRMQASCERLRYHSDRLGASQRIADDAIRRWCVTVSSFAPCSCDSFGADVYRQTWFCAIAVAPVAQVEQLPYLVGKKPPHHWSCARSTIRRIHGPPARLGL